MVPPNLLGCPQTLMQGIMKFGDRSSNDWRCCFCFHVRTGTIFLGVWHLMLHVVALSAVTIILRSNDLYTEWDEQISVLPTPLSETDTGRWIRLDGLSSDADFRHSQEPVALPSSPFKDSVFDSSDGTQYLIRHRTYNYRKALKDMNVIVVMMFCSFSITLLMVYGAVKGKPSYLMPFFCLQMFDFCLTSLTAVGYLCYLPNMHRYLAENPTVPFREQLLRLDPQVLSLLVLGAFTVVMLIKSYFIGIVWSYYKYLTLRMVANRRTIHYIESEIATMSLSESLLGTMPTTVDLPDYETAVKKFSPPPPSYACATAMAHEGQVMHPAAPVASDTLAVQVVPSDSAAAEVPPQPSTSTAAASEEAARNV
ncbi:lysosomal-associated transmembrane protein 4A isoform X1 [Thrips palmi]|uniref:Lysosomal-associated transmembrane protein 4A isoform X1 n=1 Tax=Thrips palmi TaxID=161013 RepID=A0A6P9AEY9_THRPL|nr:lysosomal-associated transmembrane protein 4A isoform X1 [Thrips palmi]